MPNRNLGDNNEIIRQITINYQMTIKSGKLQLGEDDVKLKAVKTLYQQLIDSKLQGQVSEIERRKQEFMVDFRDRLALKMLKKKEIQQIKRNSKIVTMRA